MSRVVHNNVETLNQGYNIKNDYQEVKYDKTLCQKHITLRAELIMLEQCMRLVILMQQNLRNQFRRALGRICNLWSELHISS